MATPPAPRLDIRYDVTLDRRQPVLSAFSVVTNLSKASQAEKATNAMRDALASVDVPGMILEESFAACAEAFGARPVDRRSEADFLLDLEIVQWGIEADSPGSAVALHLQLDARLYHASDREMVWRRSVSVSKPASPSMFGLGPILGDMVTAEALSNMNEHDLAEGFLELARETARAVVNKLERDFRSARYDG
jgi:hypothetical protein